MGPIILKAKPRKRLALILTALLILQVLPFSVSAQNSRIAKGSLDNQQKTTELAQDTDTGEPAPNGGAWRSKIASDLEEKVQDVEFGRKVDKVIREAA